MARFKTAIVMKVKIRGWLSVVAGVAGNFHMGGAVEVVCDPSPIVTCHLCKMAFDCI